MAWTLKNYQKGGVYDPQGRARPNIVALAKYIAHKAGIPDVRLQFTPGNYAHVNGLAVDIQPGGGSGNPEAMRALRDVIENLDWDYWGVRYAAGMRNEYGGSWGGKERKRPQTKPYVGSDGMHDRHWHLDVHPTAPVRDWQNLIRGESAPAPTTDDELTEEEMKQLDQIVSDLGKIKAAIERLERQGERNEAIATENQKRITVTREVTKTLGSDSPKIKAAIERIERNTEAGA